MGVDMVQETSIEAYKDLLYKQHIGEAQYEVILALTELGDASDTEITRHLGYLDPNKIRPRRFELVREGLVEEAGQRECGYTHRTVVTWRLSGKKEIDVHKPTIQEEQGNFDALLPIDKYNKVEKAIFEMNLFQIKKIQTILDDRKRFLEGKGE